MPITVRNLTEATVTVPVINYTFGPREGRYFPTQEFDEVYNNKVVQRLVSLNAIELSTFDIFATGEDVQVQTDIGDALVFDTPGTLVYDSGEHIVLKG